jgi:hypothetical protein
MTHEPQDRREDEHAEREPAYQPPRAEEIENDQPRLAAAHIAPNTSNDG